MSLSLIFRSLDIYLLHFFAAIPDCPDSLAFLDVLTALQALTLVASPLLTSP